MRIGELADLTQTPVDTIRYYERQRLLPRPARTGANYRAYSEGEVERLNFIRRCRGLDMSIEEVRILLLFCDDPKRKCGEVDELLDGHLAHVVQRIDELQRLARELRQLRSVCRTPGRAGQCRILQTLRQDHRSRRAGGAASAHVRASHGAKSARSRRPSNRSGA